jgi:hypothetical protein
MLTDGSANSHGRWDPGPFGVPIILPFSSRLYTIVMPSGLVYRMAEIRFSLFGRGILFFANKKWSNWQRQKSSIFPENFATFWEILMSQSFRCQRNLGFKIFDKGVNLEKLHAISSIVTSFHWDGRILIAWIRIRGSRSCLSMNRLFWARLIYIIQIEWFNERSVVRWPRLLCDSWHEDLCPHEKAYW